MILKVVIGQITAGMATEITAPNLKSCPTVMVAWRSRPKTMAVVSSDNTSDIAAATEVTITVRRHTRRLVSIATIHPCPKKRPSPHNSAPSVWI